MLFFRIKTMIYHTQHSKFAPLQVRNQRRRFRKRALSWAPLKASLTLEAAFVLPLFLFGAFLLIFPMKMLDRQRQIQAVMESVGEEISRYGYAAYCLENGGGRVDESRSETAVSQGTSMLTAAWAAARISSRIPSEWIQEPSFLGTKIGENDMTVLVMRYRMPLPFSVFGLRSIPVQSVCSRRIWNGSPGGRSAAAEAEAQPREEMVYVGKNGTRYHCSRYCHYLFHDLQAVPAGVVELKRNQEGKRYRPCAVCGSESSEQVYLLPYGTSYHTREDCRALTAYAEEVPLKEAEALGACSYCCAP